MKIRGQHINFFTHNLLYSPNSSPDLIPDRRGIEEPIKRLSAFNKLSPSCSSRILINTCVVDTFASSLHTDRKLDYCSINAKLYHDDNVGLSNLFLTLLALCKVCKLWKLYTFHKFLCAFHFHHFPRGVIIIIITFSSLFLLVS